MAYECLHIGRCIILEMSADIYTLGLSTTKEFNLGGPFAHGSDGLVSTYQLHSSRDVHGWKQNIWLYWDPPFATSASELAPISDVLVVNGGETE